ncbi:hypothetical protein [Niveispirillum sp. KHB5.9]|uniref:hypothetical protein n=1 Tax=Niveispirillum sp. KHB5.9 TaxID=3400269 RepID=UPI003A87BABF
MHHRQILDMALRELPAAKAAYLSRVADNLSRDPSLDERSHLLYPVLAAAARGIEPVLEPAECARLVTVFLVRNADGVAHVLYSPAYLRDGARAMAPWAARLQADISIAIMDQLAHGQLVLDEPKVWRFGADSSRDATFPYGEPGGEDGEEP